MAAAGAIISTIMSKTLGGTTNAVGGIVKFIGLKNIIGIGATTMGAIGHSEALTFAGVGALIGGKSAIGTLAWSGAGFAIGSMLQADNDVSSAESTSEATATSRTATDEKNRYDAESIKGANEATTTSTDVGHEPSIS